MNAVVAIEHILPAAQPVERIAAQRAAARAALARAARELDSGSIEIAFDALGAPVPSHGWHWSWTHGAALAAAVLARERVGLDLERYDAPRISKLERVFDAEELARLGQVTDLELARLWTAKEALLKRAGTGLAELSACRFVGRDERARFVLELRGARSHIEHRTFGTHVIALAGPEAVWLTDVGLEVERV